MRRWAINGPLVIRRGLIGTAAAFGCLLILAALLAAAFDAGYFRAPFIRFLAAHSGRQVRIEGPLKSHIFSLHPRLIAEGVTIGNPPWMPAGTTAEVGKISLVIELPGFDHSIGIQTLEMEGVTLHLLRDSSGHANWQMSNPDSGSSGALPIIHSLSVHNAHVDLDDERRHLRFDGTVSADDLSGDVSGPVNGAANGAANGAVSDVARLRPLRIAGNGQLNGRAASFEISGDPLTSVRRNRHYGFTFDERSSGSRLTGRGFLLRPFYFDALDTTFEGAGADLKDLYFLTGVTLVNTGSYKLSGKLARRGTNSKFSDLLVTSGQSDIRGTVSIESSSGRPNLDVELNSQFLRIADLGEQAAGHAPTGPPLLMSNAMFTPSAVRRDDAVVNFRATRVELRRVSLRMVAAKMTIDHGIVVVAPASADILGGKLTAHLDLDASKEIPAARVDLKFNGLQVGEIDRKGTGQPPLEGLLHARISVTGQGRSIHQIAATANGAVTAVLPHGTMRESLAELTGIDLRGLGIFIAKNTQETGVRCGVASFQAQQGILTAQSLVVDTDAVLITGNGATNLDSEALDLQFRGHPKKLRLMRIRSPILLRGTLTHPAISIQARNSVGQAAEAVALGVALTPLAAVLALVDPGLAKDADCAALLADAKANESATPAAASKGSHRVGAPVAAAAR